MLTGPPRIGGVLTPLMALDAPADFAWTPETTWREYDDGRREPVEVAYRLVGSGAWDGLSYADIKQFQGLLGGGVVDVTPRTRVAGDPPIAELLVPCEVTSDLQETTPLYRTDSATGVPMFRFAVEFRSVVTYARIPGALYGGLVLLGEDDEAATVDPWGIAALVEEAVVYEFDGDDFDAVTVTLTPDEIADLVLVDDPSDPDVVLLDAINDFQAPPPDA